jgi:hypothetical protein
VTDAVAVCVEATSVAVTKPVVAPIGTTKSHAKAPVGSVVIVEPTKLPTPQRVGVSEPATPEIATVTELLTVNPLPVARNV